MNILHHKAKWGAARKKQNVASADTTTLSIWAGQVKADWDRLKAEPDHAERDRQKTDLVQRYWDEYLQGWIASGESQQNDVLAVVCVWAADVPDCPVLMDLMDAAVATNQQLPTWLNFKSDLLTHVTDTIRNRAESSYKASQQGVVDGQLRAFSLPDDFYAVLERVQAAVWPVNFVSLAKCHKLAGLAAESVGDLKDALEHYREANKYPNVGVKTRLELVEKMVTPQ